MAKVGDIRAFVDLEGRAVYGRVLAEALGALTILDTTGAFYSGIPEDDTVGVGQRTRDGEMLMPSSRIAYEVSIEVEPYLEDPMVELVTKRLVGGYAYKTPVARTDLGPQRKERPSYHSYGSIPLRMFKSRELDASGKPKMTVAMEKYLFSSDERRARFDGLLKGLRLRAPIQWLAYVCVELRGMKQADVCRIFNKKDGNISVAYAAGKEWMDARMGTNVAGA